MLRRCGEGKVRRHEGHEQHPRLAGVLGALLAQPDLCARADLFVIESVGRLAWSGHRSHFSRSAAPWHILPHQAQQIPLALDDVHGYLLFGKAVVFVWPAEMQLSDRDYAVAVLTQQVMPGGHRAVVGVGVVPEADLVNVLPDGEARARRDANGARGIGVGEDRAARREGVEARCLDGRMLSVPGDFRVVLIGHDDQEIQRAHLGYPKDRLCTYRTVSCFTPSRALQALLAGERVPASGLR